MKTLEKNKKYIIISVVTLLLIIPMFFGLYIENLFTQISSIYPLLVLFGGLVVLLTVGELMDIFVLDTKSLELIKEHDVIQALITKKKRLVILSVFLITMIMEELIFRYYFLSLLFHTLTLDLILVLFISSLVFALYHIHIWFTYKNLRIFGIFLFNSFLLGFLLGLIFLTLGFFFCVLIHSLVALLFYFNLFNRYYKTRSNQN